MTFLIVTFFPAISKLFFGFIILESVQFCKMPGLIICIADQFFFH